MRLKPLVAAGVVVASMSGLAVLANQSSAENDLEDSRLSSLAPTADPDEPLSGMRVVLDPGHQLGNAGFPAEIAAPVPAGGLRKACNSTGTATNSGFPEATFAWNVARDLEDDLEALGAKVVLTRKANSASLWGPCVDARGKVGNPRRGHRGADLKISIHGDGSNAAGAHGFHVIYAPDRAPWTADTYAESRRLALDTRTALDDAGFDRATYVAGGSGLDERADLGTLNLSDVPTVMVELGNMRDSKDAAKMSSARGQSAYADALAEAAQAFLGK